MMMLVDILKPPYKPEENKLKDKNDVAQKTNS